MRVRILFPVEGISKYFNQKDGIVNIKVKITDSFFSSLTENLLKIMAETKNVGRVGKCGNHRMLQLPFILYTGKMKHVK